MQELHQGLDYRPYKIYVWGGLALLVAYLSVSIIVFETANLPNRQVFLRLLLPLMLYVMGIFLYWCSIFLFEGNRDLAELSRQQEQGVPGIRALNSWNTLHQAMAVSGGNEEQDYAMLP